MKEQYKPDLDDPYARPGEDEIPIAFSKPQWVLIYSACREIAEQKRRKSVDGTGKVLDEKAKTESKALFSLAQDIQGFIHHIHSPGYTKHISPTKLKEQEKTRKRVEKEIEQSEIESKAKGWEG